MSTPEPLLRVEDLHVEFHTEDGVVHAVDGITYEVHRGRTLGIVLSITVLFIYYALDAVARAFGKNGALDPYLAAWLPNIIVTSVGGWLVWREDR